MDEEKVLGVIPNVTRQKGLFRREAFNLVVTGRRLIAAALTSQMIKDEAARVSREAKEQGQGLLKRMWATATSGYTLHQRYFSTPVADIISESPGNFVVEPSEVRSIRVKKGFWSRRDGRHGKQTPDELIIDWSGGRSVFQLGTGSMSAGEARELLGRVFGATVK